MLSNNEIIIIAMAFATVVMIIYKIANIMYCAHMFKRWNARRIYVQQLAQEDIIDTVLINVNTESNRVDITDRMNGVIVDGKIYNNRNSLFFEENNIVYIIGKKEEYIIGLVGMKKRKGIKILCQM